MNDIHDCFTDFRHVLCETFFFFFLCARLIEQELQMAMSYQVGAGNQPCVLHMSHSALNHEAISPGHSVLLIAVQIDSWISCYLLSSLSSRDARASREISISYFT